MSASSKPSPAKRLGGVTGKGWEPGRSGNAGGRPKAVINVQELARSRTQQAIDALTEALRDPRTKVQAAVALLDRGWGRPVQAITTDSADGPQSLLLLHLTAARGEPLRDALAPKHTLAALPIIESKAKGGEQPNLYEPALE